MSERQRILEAWKTRLETTGYPVALGAIESFGANDPTQALLLVPGDDQVRTQGDKLFVDLAVTVYALVDVDLAEPWVAVEAMVAAIKTTVETSDHQLNGAMRRPFERGATRTMPREPGTTTVGASVTYVVHFEETWGQP